MSSCRRSSAGVSPPASTVASTTRCARISATRLAPRCRVFSIPTWATLWARLRLRSSNLAEAEVIFTFLSMSRHRGRLRILISFGDLSRVVSIPYVSTNNCPQTIIAVTDVWAGASGLPLSGLATIARGLIRPVEEWTVGGIPVTSLMAHQHRESEKQWEVPGQLDDINLNLVPLLLLCGTSSTAGYVTARCCFSHRSYTARARRTAISEIRSCARRVGNI